MEWIYSVNRVLNERGMSVEQGRMNVRDRSECMSKDVALTILGRGSRTSGVTLASYQVQGG